jgi:hypothetical protein
MYKVSTIDQLVYRRFMLDPLYVLTSNANTLTRKTFELPSSHHPCSRPGHSKRDPVLTFMFCWPSHHHNNWSYWPTRGVVSSNVAYMKCVEIRRFNDAAGTIPWNHVRHGINQVVFMLSFVLWRTLVGMCYQFRYQRGTNWHRDGKKTVRRIFANSVRNKGIYVNLTGI